MPENRISRDEAAARLKVSPNATPDEIRTAYGRLFRETKTQYLNEFIPDRRLECETDLVRIREAAECLLPGITDDRNADLPSIRPMGFVPVCENVVLTTQRDVDRSPSSARILALPVSTLIAITVSIFLVVATLFFAFQWRRQLEIAQFTLSGPLVPLPSAIVFQNVDDDLASAIPTGGITQSIALQLKPTAEQSLTRAPHDLRVLNNVAVVLSAAGETVRGSALFKQAHAGAANNPTIAYNYGRDLYQQGQMLDAAIQARSALRQKPDFDQAKLLLVAIALNEKDYNSAARELAQLSSNAEVPALIMTGVVELSKKRIPESVARFKQALALSSKNSAALYNAALASHLNREFEAAKRYYLQALNQDGALAPAHNNLGILLAKDGDLNGAIGHFETVRYDNVAAKNLEFASRLLRHRGP